MRLKPARPRDQLLSASIAFAINVEAMPETSRRSLGHRDQAEGKRLRVQSQIRSNRPGRSFV